jgi:hypothetical protein
LYVEEKKDKFFETLIQIKKVLNSNSKNNFKQTSQNKIFQKKDFNKGLENRLKALNKYQVIVIGNKGNLPKQEFIFVEPYELTTNYPEGIRTLLRELKLELIDPGFEGEESDLFHYIFYQSYYLTPEEMFLEDEEFGYKFTYEKPKRPDFYPIQSRLKNIKRKLINYSKKILGIDREDDDPMFPIEVQEGFIGMAELANPIDIYFKNANFSSSIRPICLIFNAGDENKVEIEEYYKELVTKISDQMKILRFHGSSNELKKLENINLMKMGLGDLIYKLSEKQSATNIVYCSPFKNKQKSPLKRNIIRRAERFRKKLKFQINI